MAKAREPDPPTQVRVLARDVAEQGLARGYVLRGEERYFHERAIEHLRAKAKELGYDVRTHSAQRGDSDFALPKLLDDLSGGGLFAKRSLVIVKHPEELLKKSGSEKSALAKAIEAFVASPEDAGTVVLSAAGSLRADHSTVKAIKAAGGPLLTLRKLWDSPPPWKPDPRQAELVLWLVARAREIGLRLDPSQAVYVCAATGNDLAALDDHLTNLKNSPGDGLRDVVSWNAATAPWTVAEHLVAGDLPRGLTGVETLFRGGFLDKTGRRTLDGIALSSMLVGSLQRGARQAFLLASQLADGKDEQEALRAAGVAGRPGQAEAAVQRARSRSAGEWRRMVESLADLERRAKTGSSLDANDFATFALRWGASATARR